MNRIEYVITREKAGFYIYAYDHKECKVLNFPNRESNVFHTIEEASDTVQILYAQDEIMKDIEKVFGTDDE